MSRIIYLFLFLWVSLQAEDLVIPLKGHLSSEVLSQASTTLKGSKANPVILEINSTSGELNAALDLARTIYEKKQTQNLKVIVYINENALGPSAIFPLLADELNTSLFVSWGDIPLGSEKTLPTNILRNKVSSLITPQQPKSLLLTLLANAMADPSVIIVDDNGWKQQKGGTASKDQMVSTEGAPLVINQLQIKQLGLAHSMISSEEFEAQYLPKKEENINVPVVKETLPNDGFPQHILFNPEGKNTIGLITIDDRSSGISQATWLYVKSALDYYKKNRPAFIILQLNTPGGEVFAAQKISDALKEMDTQNNIPIVAYINNWAISAGAMLAYSSRYIITVKDGSMGAAEPVIAEASGEMKQASEKVNSALRTDFSNRASFFNRNPYIAEGMVDKDIILVERFGNVIKLDNENQIRTTGPDYDVIVKPKGKLLTLNSQEMIKYKVADMLVPPTKLPEITQEEKSTGKWPANKLALFHQPFFDKISNASIDEYKMDWKTRFFVLLAHPIVASILFLGLIMGLYMEMSSPGFGLPATIAATCLFLILLSSFSQEIGNWLEVILLLTGLGILLVELFVLPTFGLLGFIGLAFFLMGLFGLMLPGVGEVHYEVDTKTLNAAGEAFVNRLAWLSGTLVLALVLIPFLSRFLGKKIGPFRRFVLDGSEQDASKGYIATELPSHLPKIGDKGVAATTLRPSGKIIIADMQYDAITAGGFIEQGSPIVVTKLDGSVIVVNENPEEKNSE